MQSGHSSSLQKCRCREVSIRYVVALVQQIICLAEKVPAASMVALQVHTGYVASDILESFISGMERIFGKGACVKLNIRYLGGLNLLEQEDI